MKRVILFISVFMTVALFSGCAVNSSFCPTSSAVLCEGNFKVVRPIGREAESIHIAFYGGKKVRDCKEQAIASMAKELKDNQALAYINVTQSRSHFIPWVLYKSKVMVSAVIVEFEKQD